MNVKYERFCFPVNLKCNLRCKLCAEHAPYYEKPYYPSFTELTEQLDALFHLVEHIGKFDITGGEPFLRNDLPEVIRYIYDHYRSQIGKIRVSTNGTLLPPDGFVESAKLWEDDFFIIVDNYSVSHKSKEVSEILKLTELAFELRDYSTDLHCDGWVDYGDFTLKHTKEEAKQIFKNCAVPKLGFFSCMVNGIIFPCAKARLLYERFILNNSVDLFDDALTENGKKARMKALLEEEVIEACKYCNGLCEDGARFKPAEQLTTSKEEARKTLETEDWHLNYGKVLFYTQTYNNEKTIARTIESVLNQTNKDFTYFVCDNGSTDNTGNIIRKYAAANECIVHVECERNDVLAAILIPFQLFAYVPKYLDNYYCIIDGDDYIEPNFLEKVMNILSKHDVEMIVPAYSRVSAEDGTIINQRRLQEDVVVSGHQKVDHFTAYRSLLLCQWGKVYKYSKFRKTSNVLLYNCYLKLPKWFHQLDTVGVLSIFYQCKQVAFIADPVYNYTISSQSTYGNYLPNRIQNDVLMFQIYNNFLNKFEPTIKVNQDFCFAIYLSLLYENLNSLFNTKVVNTAQKLSDLYDILSAEETKCMLTSEFDPMFNNLAHRDDFLILIRDYIQSLSLEEQHIKFINDIVVEMNKYGDYSV